MTTSIEPFRVGLVTGGFDPVHKGHIQMIQEARRRCSALYVGVNDDTWLIQKKGYYLLPAIHRVAVMGALEGVYEAFAFASRDGTAASALRYVRHATRNAGPKIELVFFQGGDRDESNVPHRELEECDRMEFGIGGSDKAGSSTDFFLSAVRQASGRSIFAKVK